MHIANLFIKRTFASLPKRSIEKGSPGCILVRATLRNNAANFKFEKFATLHSERRELEREREEEEDCPLSSGKFEQVVVVVVVCSLSSQLRWHHLQCCGAGAGGDKLFRGSEPEPKVCV